jgi:hypothetical protein
MQLPEIIETFNALVSEFPLDYDTLLAPRASAIDSMEQVDDVIDGMPITGRTPEQDKLRIEMQYLKAALNPLVAEEREKNA